MKSMKLPVLIGGLGVVLTAPGVVRAVEQTFDATGDVWLREVSPDTTFENDWVSVWSSPTGDTRYGLMQWDISSLAGLPLTSAKLSLWVGDDFSGTVTPVKQSAFVLDTTGLTDIFNSTWNTVQNEHLTPGTETALESLGSYDQGVPLDLGIEGTYQDSDPASAADLALLEAIASGTGTLTVLMIAAEDGTDYKGDWGDGANAGGSGFGPDTPGRLVVDVVPEPTSLALLGLGWLALGLRRRKA